MLLRSGNNDDLPPARNDYYDYYDDDDDSPPQLSLYLATIHHGALRRRDMQKLWNNE